jgi:hypothetical protein
MPAAAVFIFIGPIVAASVAALCRWALGPQIALLRLRLGDSAPVWVSIESSGLVGHGTARLVRVDELAHLRGEDVHGVVPVATLSARDPSEPIVVATGDGAPMTVQVGTRWRDPFRLAVSQDGPRLHAASRRARWIMAPHWTMSALFFMTMLAAWAAAVVVRGTLGTGEVLDEDVDAQLCDIWDYAGEGSEHWIDCWVRPPVGETIAFNNLAWPFEGQAYDRWTAWTLVAVPMGLAIAFAAGHLFVARSGRRDCLDGHRRDRHGSDAQGPNSHGLDRHGSASHSRVGVASQGLTGEDLVYRYLPDAATALAWPDCPDDRTDPEPQQPAQTQIDTDDSLGFHALLAGDGRWSLVLVDQFDGSSWLLAPDSQPPLRGLVWLPRERPPVGLMRLTFRYSRAAVKAPMRDDLSRWVAYRDLRKADKYALAGLREDVEGQLRDQTEPNASAPG